MAVRQDTIWDKFLKPIVTRLIDQEALAQLYKSIDWERESYNFRQPDLIYPTYYSSQNFHGIKYGYLNPSAAISYDPITHYALQKNTGG